MQQPTVLLTSMSGLRSKSQRGGTLGWRNLWVLAEDGDVEALQNRVDQSDLLKHVNDLDTSGKTALHFACYANRLEVALFLLKCGASVTIKDFNGKTPIDIAMSRGHTQMSDEIHAAAAREATAAGLGGDVWLLVAAGAGMIAVTAVVRLLTHNHKN